MSTVAASPAASQAPSFQLFGPSLIRGSKLAFWRTAKTPPDAGQASAPPTALPGMETPTIARSVAMTNWGDDRGEEDPEDRERRADDEAGRDGPGGVGRLPRRPARHDEIAEDHPAEGEERDREEQDLAVQGLDHVVGHRVDRRQGSPAQAVEPGPV